MKEYTQNQLENIFANNFASPLFPVLANIYYNKQEYERAQKVCEIGLSHNTHNHTGQYILSKIYIANKQYLDAEKILKTVVENDSHNINALIDLVETQKILKRSNDTIQNYIDIGLTLQIKHKLFKKSKIPIKKSSNKSSSKERIARNTPAPKKAIQLSTNIATKTMYTLMIDQQKYDIARSILVIMKEKKKNLKFVNLEFKKLEKLINQRKK